GQCGADQLLTPRRPDPDQHGELVTAGAKAGTARIIRGRTACTANMGEGGRIDPVDRPSFVAAEAIPDGTSNPRPGR
ncbi:hypothetical protein, partial [Nocardia sp. NPDC003648]